MAGASRKLGGDVRSKHRQGSESGRTRGEGVMGVLIGIGKELETQHIPG